MFLMVGGRLFFSTMVGGRCSIQYLVGGRWHKVGGQWSVVGGWSVGSGFILRHGRSPSLICIESKACKDIGNWCYRLSLVFTVLSKPFRLMPITRQQFLSMPSSILSSQFYQIIATWL